jgi:hypothetical protein
MLMVSVFRDESRVVHVVLRSEHLWGRTLIRVVWGEERLESKVKVKVKAMV